jgi:hypothetical protein
MTDDYRRACRRDPSTCRRSTKTKSIAFWLRNRPSRASQIALISGDVSSDTTAEGDADAESICRHCLGLTNYSNGYDEVLQISNIKSASNRERDWSGCRRQPHPVPSLSIAVNTYAASITPHAPGVAGITTSHSWQFGNPVFTEDLAQTRNGNVDRSVIATRDVRAANRYVLKIPNSG